MGQHVLVNRRCGIYTNSGKIASRATVETTLSLVKGAKVVTDHQPEDQSARQVVLLDADSNEVAAIRSMPQHSLHLAGFDRLNGGKS